MNLLNKHMKISNFSYTFLAIFILFFSCISSALKEDYQTSFDKLPKTVQSEFVAIGKTENMFMVCRNTNENCNTSIRSESPFQATMSNAYLIIETCTDTYRIDFSLTSARYFVVDKNKIFFTKSKGFSLKGDTPLEESLDIKTLSYGVIKLNN